MTQESVSTSEIPEAPATVAPWTGRLLLLVGVVLLGLSLRHAITAVSPLLSTIQDDLGLGTAGATVLGMLPTVAFGLAGFATPTIIRRLGLPLTAVVALGLGAAGTLIRVLGDSSAVFLIFGAVALFGMGMGNVVGPPLVKRYFADRQGAVMSAFVLTMQAGATIPAMLTLPLAEAAGWRVAVGLWASLMVLAALPWVGALVNDRDQSEAVSPVQDRTGFSLSTLIRNPVSIGAALFYGMAALNTYALLAWLPVIFQSLGLSQSDAGRMYAIYTFMTLPMAVIAPIMATRLRNPLPFGVLLSMVAAVGYLGIILAPLSTAAVWVFIAGIGGGAFPFALTMFNLRTRTTPGSAAITGFALGCGYAFGTIGPFLGGLLSSSTGGWTVPLLVLAATAIPMAVGAVLLTRDRKFEDLLLSNQASKR